MALRNEWTGKRAFTLPVSSSRTRSSITWVFLGLLAGREFAVALDTFLRSNWETALIVVKGRFQGRNRAYGEHIGGTRRAVALLKAGAEMTTRSRSTASGTARTPWRTLVAVCALCFPFVESSADAAEEIARLKARIEARSAPDDQAIEEIRLEQGVAPVSLREPPPKRTPSVLLSADLSYRLDTINDAALSVRHKHRIRARVSAIAYLNDSITTDFGLSTGGHANDSGNQTLGEGFSRKPIDLDLAYFDWRISERLSLLGGKMSNSFFRPGNHHLLYDSDLRPEGLALTMDTGRIFGNVSAFWAEEREKGPNSLWWGIQAGYHGESKAGLDLTAGASFHEITHTQNRFPFFTYDSTASGASATT